MDERKTLRLSILVPVYNTAPYLRACLDSLVDRARQEEYEVVVVNDGSTDDSGTILGEYAERFPGLIKPVETPNGGLGHARNIGLSLARGENILFVDSDDCLAEGTLDEIFEVLEQDFDIAVFDFYHVDGEGNRLAHFAGCERKEAFRLSDYPEFLFSPLNACNKIWKKKLFTENGIAFPDRLWFEDLATSPKLYLHADRILPVGRSWYLYLQRKGSITNANRIERNIEMKTAISSVTDYYAEMGLFEQYRDQLCYMGFYHEFLTSVVRVNLTDPKSKIQAELRDDYRSRFPDYQNNRYFRRAPFKYRLLESWIRKGNWKAVHLLMKMNNRVKGR